MKNQFMSETSFKTYDQHTLRKLLNKNQNS